MTCPTIICQTVARGSADTTVATTACWSSAAALLLLFALGVISPSLLAFANYTAAAHAAVIIPAMGSWPRLGHVLAHLMSCCTSSLSPTLLPLIWSASLVICRASECTIQLSSASMHDCFTAATHADVPLLLAKARDNTRARDFLTPDRLPTSLANGSLLLG